MKKVLIVDNDQILLKFIAPRLEREGHQVMTAEDGFEALGIMKTFIPDVIFVDLIMPRIDGDKLCQVIRTMPALKDAYLVIVSAAVSELDFDYKKTGADACIAKASFGKTTQNFIDLIAKLDHPRQETGQEEIIGIKEVYKRQITKELLSHNKHLESILESTTEGILEVISGVIIYANSKAIELFGIPEGKLLASALPDFFHKVDRDFIKTLLDEDNTEITGNTPEAPLRLNDYLVTVRKLQGKGDYASTMVLINDITEQKKSEEMLRQSEVKYKTLVHNIPGMVYRILPDFSCEIISGSEQVCGVSCEEINILEQGWLSLLHPDDKEKVINETAVLMKRQRDLVQTYRIVLGEDHVRWIEDRKTSLFDKDGNLLSIDCIVFDITDRSMMEEELRRLAITDPLTGANNRRYFFRKAQEEMMRALRYGRSMAVLMMDIDHFKNVNDSYGHDVGDMVLKAVVKYCIAAFRKTDIFGRMGGEEFAAVLLETDLTDALQVAERLRHQLASIQVATDSEKVAFTVSIGIATKEDTDGSLEEILKRADEALYKAKKCGRNRVECHIVEC